MDRLQRPYKAINFPPLTQKQAAMLERLDKVPDSEIDTSDTPECSGNGGPYYIQTPKPKQDKA